MIEVCKLGTTDDASKGNPAPNLAFTGQPGDIVFVPSTKTPSISEIGSILNAAFFADRLFQEGLFGFRPLGFLGR